MKQETIAGVALQQTYKPSIAASEYPVPATKPLSSVVSSSDSHADKLKPQTHSIKGAGSCRIGR